jgi:hypothetical protein
MPFGYLSYKNNLWRPVIPAMIAMWSRYGAMIDDSGFLLFIMAAARSEREILFSHGGKYEDGSLLGYCVVSGRSP